MSKNQTKEEKETVQQSEESIDSEKKSDDFVSAQSLPDDRSDSIRKSVKFEQSQSLLEVIEVSPEVSDNEDETEKLKAIRLDFIPRSSTITDDVQEHVPKAATEEGNLESKSEYHIEDQPVKNDSSMEAFQFVKRYSATNTKIGELGNALVTDAFVSWFSIFFFIIRVIIGS